MNIEKLQMERLVLEISYKMNASISKQLYQTKALAALVIQGDGVVNNFERVASVIAENLPALANFILAPGGIVTDVYPLEGNEAVLGLDFFNELEHYGNKEAILARDTGDLVMAGPFLLLQGIVGLVGRYPVYIATEAGINRFWGLVSVSLKFPDALDDTGISLLEHKGFSYKLWRINPDTNEKQVIASSSGYADYNVSYVERPVMIHNAEWCLRIFSKYSWAKRLEAWLFIFAGLCISVLIAILVQKHFTLKTVKHDLQGMVDILNNMAVKFLAERNMPFDAIMAEENFILADVVDIDRFSIWRNSIISDELHTSQIYRWDRAAGGTTKALDDFANVPYAKLAPNLKKKLMANRAVNGPARLLPEHEAATLKAYGIISVFVTPIFIDNTFWGFMFFENHRSECYFEDSHAKFMHSAAFLLAAAIKRDEMEREIAEANNLLRILYDNAPIGMNTFDKNFCFIDHNKKMFEVLGVQAHEHHDFLKKFSPEEQPCGTKSEDMATELFHRTMKGEKIIFKWIFKSAADELIPCEVTIMCTKYKGETIGLSYIYDLRHVENMKNQITQLENELLQSQIAIMISQIQPHFLFNSLVAIQELCLMDPEVASEAVGEFSNYLRGNIESLAIKKLVPFEKELRHVETYLSLEKMRFGNKLNIVYELSARDFFLPALTVQPIVENAVRHGIHKREEGGTVTVRSRETETSVVITVTDDGPGFDIGSAHGQGGRSMGIENVRSRLAFMCRGELSIQSEPGFGTTAVIIIPRGVLMP